MASSWFIAIYLAVAVVALALPRLVPRWLARWLEHAGFAQQWSIFARPPAVTATPLIQIELADGSVVEWRDDSDDGLPGLRWVIAGRRRRYLLSMVNTPALRDPFVDHVIATLDPLIGVPRRLVVSMRRTPIPPLTGDAEHADSVTEVFAAELDVEVEEVDDP